MEHSLETLESCPSCKTDSFRETLRCVDSTYSKDTFTIVECVNCGLHFTNPRPTESVIGKYYDNPDYVSHTDTQQGFLFKVYALVKNYTLGKKEQLLSSLTADKTVLDYGAGSGDFSNYLQQSGWSVSAFEPDPNARGLIEKKNPSINLVNTLNEISEASLSVITLWHVLEHVHRLDETLDEFKRILKPNGNLIIAVPNHTSYDAKVYREGWAAYDLPRHLYHFNPKTIEPLLKQVGFELVAFKPMWFDSIYVSLLSEKNRGYNGLIAWLRAGLIGSLSNLKTVFDTSKCSSIIYIFQKSE
ncbi:MAG: methyltransferase domain-containing protein [Flavobacteriales bacterium]|nr:methyltransferase domain-containing protein [Flavobacteriales bacterium]